MNEQIQPGELFRIRPDGRYEIYLDATMASSLALCPQYFKYSFIDCITPKGERPFARDLGSWWSEVMENIYGAMHQSKRLTSEEIVSTAMRVWTDLKMDELEKFHPRSYKQFGGRHGAIAMIAEYAQRQLPIDYSSWKIIAAESSFGRNKEVCIGETNKIILYWMGQPDLYVIQQDRVMPVDHKSVATLDAKTIKKYKPNVQIPGYIIAGQILVKSLGYDLPIDRCIINAVARTDSSDKDGVVKKPRFKRFQVAYSPEELAEWKRNRLLQAEELRTYLEAQNWRRNEGSCPNQWNHVCPYLNIDEKPPETRQIVINADYVKRDFWIPGRKEKTKSEEE
jgi:hypothetical protein